jgi:hypothetical protein
MSRRSFFQQVATLLTGVTAAPWVKAATVLSMSPDVAAVVSPPAAVVAPPSGANTPSERCIELQRSPVAGFQYHKGESVWPALKVGMPLELVREPANTYDERAVRVDWQGHKLGYVPRIDNAAVSHLLDQDEILTAQVMSLKSSANPWDRIELSIFLKL